MGIKISEKLKQVRRMKGFSQQHIADHTGVKRSTVAKIERDDQRPPLDFLMSFATLCNISLDNLTGMDEHGNDISFVQEDTPSYGKKDNIFQSIQDLANSQDPFEKSALSQKLTRAIGELMEENAKLKSEVIEWLKHEKR